MASLKALWRDKQLWFALLLALGGVILAYQIRIPFTLDVGGQTDRILWSWVHDPVFDKATQTRYRWTTGGTELDLRGWGANNPVEIRFRAARGQPQNHIAALTLYVNDVPIAELPADTPDWHEYVVQVTQPRALANADLRIRFESDTFVPRDANPESADRRRLGVKLDSLSVSPLRQANGAWQSVNTFLFSPTALPPLELALGFVGCAFVIYLLLFLFAMPRPLPFVGAALYTIAATLALILERPYVTLFAFDFLAILAGGVIAALCARWLVQRLFRWGGVTAPSFDLNLLALIFAFAFVVKMAMLLYPQTISFDLLYHIHRLQDVMGGLLFWSIPSGKNEFGGQPVPYLPSYYLFLSPFAQFLPLRLLVQLSGVLLDSATIFILYYWLKKYFDAPRAGLFAAWIFTLAPLTFVGLSWGIYANLFGQFLTLVLMVALIESVDHLSRRNFIVVTLLLTLTLLSHTSVFVSIVPLLAIWVILVLAVSRPRANFRLLASIALATLAAFALYYSQFVNLVAASTTSISEASLEQGSLNVAGETLNFLQLLQPARTEFTAVPLYVYALALFGAILIARQSFRSPSRGRLLMALMLLACFATFALLLFVRAQFGFSARYVNFIMPVLALCAGLGCAWMYERGWLGRIAAWGVVLLLAAQGLYHWYVLVFFKYH